MRKLLVAVVVLCSGLALAQTCDPLLDSSRLEKSKARAAANPLGDSHLKRARAQKERYGLSANDDFRVLRAEVDELGFTHVHFEQRSFGVPVKGAALISHQDRAGSFIEDTISVVPGITSATPRVTPEEAIRVVEQDKQRVAPFVTTPTAVLWHEPRYVTVLARTGEPAPGPMYDPEADVSIPEPLTADDVRRQLVGVALVYEVDTTEGDCATREYRHRRWTIDALTGTVLRVRDADPAAVGSGSGAWQKNVTFQTTNTGSYYTMYDSVREFTTEDEDVSGSPVSCDSNNVWGDGQNFMGDFFASTSNRQSALVDIHFGATVYWDLLSKVFNMQGPDDDYYSVNAFVHDGTNWDNAQYHSGSGNVSFGDGSGPLYTDNRTQLDCAGHELGHAWNDHQVDFDGDTDCLNESLADIFGEWTDAYLASNGFANGSTSLPSSTTFNDWKNRCSGRSLIKPGVKYWFNGVQDIEEHKGSGPSSRAFAFLARGASPVMRDPSYSHRIPWGMTGIGLSDAARIYFKAMKSYMNPGDGYQGLRPAMYAAAKQLFGTNSAQVKAVFNAYAGISIGTTAAGYPTKPSTTSEVEPNNTKSAPQSLSFPALPAGAPADAPRKLHVVGAATTSQDWYRVSVPSLRTVTFQYSSTNLLDIVKVQLHTDAGLVQEVIVPGGTAAQLSKTCTSLVCSVWVTVVPVSTVVGTYTLDIDLEPSPF